MNIAAAVNKTAPTDTARISKRWRRKVSRAFANKSVTPPHDRATDSRPRRPLELPVIGRTWLEPLALPPATARVADGHVQQRWRRALYRRLEPVSYTHLTLPTNREV